MIQSMEVLSICCKVLQVSNLILSGKIYCSSWAILPVFEEAETTELSVGTSDAKEFKQSARC